MVQLGKAPGGGHGNPLQYPCLENPMDRGAWWDTVCGVTKIRTWLSNEHFHFHHLPYLGSVVTTEDHSLLHSTSFPTNVLFVSQDPIHDITLHLVVMCLQPALVSDEFLSISSFLRKYININIYIYTYMPHFYPFICWQTLGLLAFSFLFLKTKG